MELFIQIKNGQPFEHPIFGDNFREAFPHVDVNNLPPEFARFERVPCPEEATQFEVDQVSYQWVDGVVKDVWSVRPMTDNERAEKIEQITQAVLNKWESYKYITQKNIDTATDPAIKQLWIDHLVELSAWVLVDPLLPKFPKPPLVLNNGTVYTVNDAGSVPNVIE